MYNNRTNKIFPVKNFRSRHSENEKKKIFIVKKTMINKVTHTKLIYKINLKNIKNLPFLPVNLLLNSTSLVMTNNKFVLHIVKTVC